MKKVLFLFLLAFVYSGFVSAQNVFLSQDFEGSGMPAGWEQSTAAASSDGWKLGNAQALSSQYFTFPAHTRFIATNDDKCGENCDKSNDVIYSPAFEIPSTAQSCFLKFDVFFAGSTYQGKTEKANVLISKDNGENWTNLGEIPGNSSDWQTYSINIGEFIGNNCRVAFQYTDGGGWLFGIGLDNITVLEPTDPREVKLTSATTSEFNVINTPSKIKGTFESTGAEVVTSIEVNWSINGGAPQSTTISGLNVGYTGGGSFEHTIPFSLTEPKIHTLDVWISKVNGGEDTNPDDNKITQKVYGITTAPTKHLVVEEFTGAWCQFCPIGHFLLKELINSTQNVHGVAVHNQDGMTIPEGATLENAVQLGGFPSFAVDRKVLEGETTIALASYGSVIEKAQTRIDDIVPASVDFTKLQYNNDTREISVEVQADVFGEYDGLLRFNCYILEDDVTGTGSGFDQKNATNNDQELGPGIPNPFYQKGNPMVGYKHMHTLRAFVGGVWGERGTFPNTGTIQAEQTFTHNFSYILPQGYKPENTKVIVTVAKYHATDAKQREIFNSKEEDLPFTTAVAKNELGRNLSVYPNPTDGMLNINYNGPRAVSATVMSATGQLVGTYTIDRSTRIDLSSMTAGVYMINFNDGVNVYTHKVIVR